MSTTPPLLIITARAAGKIREVIDGQKVPEGYCLRVGVRGGLTGCGGVSYLLGFDMPKEEDMLETVDGIPVIIDRKQSMYVMGMEIDWHEDEDQQGFVFNNPSKRAD